MSARWYPLYQQGNPQLRVFLPNFWMKLVKPKEPQPPNVVQFIVPTGMTSHDIRQYVEKIYNVPVMEVRSQIEGGFIHPAFKGGYLVKDDDFRRAYVTLPRDQKFEFPEMDVEKVRSKNQEDIKKYKQELATSKQIYAKMSKGRKGVPSWFSI